MTYVCMYRDGAWVLSEGNRTVGRYPSQGTWAPPPTGAIFVRLSVAGRVTTVQCEGHILMRSWRIGPLAIMLRHRRFPTVRWVGRGIRDPR